MAWLRAHQPDRLRRARWLLGPRDLVFWRLTGEVATDTTFAGRSGFYDRRGALAPDTAAGFEELLPPVRASTTSLPRAAFLNLTPAQGPGDLARALYEAVAYDVARSLEALSPVGGSGDLAATGGGVAGPLWVQLLAAVTGRPVVLRRSGEAASAGACLLTGRAVGAPLELDRINPVVATTRPEASLAKRYRDLRPLVDRVADGVLGLDLSEWSTGWT